MKKLFVALSTFGEYGSEPIELLRSSGLDFSVNPTGKRLTPEQIVELAADCEGIIAGVEPYNAPVLERLPQLRCISRCGAGIDNVDQQKAKEMGVAILNTPDVVIRPVAELTVAMILDLMRNLSVHAQLMKNRSWQKQGGHLLSGKHVGIIGFGRIGQKVAQLLKPFDVKIGYFDLRQVWIMISNRFEDLNSLLEWADIITVHASIGAQGKPLLGRDELRRMKPGSWIVNTARGGLVDEDALYEALKSGHLAGAALDVFLEEPYTGKLCELDNVVLTPHVATLTGESRLAMEIEASENIIRFFKNGR